MKPGNMNSHIQMPRFLLSRFENEYHSFFYYDVEKGLIGTNGHAKSMNTEHGYYPDVIEKYFSNELEQPFSKFLRRVDSLDINKPSFAMTNLDETNIKQFFISLIVRSPLLIDGIKENSVFFPFYSPTDQHTIAISQGIIESQKIFDNYHATFTVNITSKPFILPICGIYNYKLNGYMHISLPVSPKIAITLIESSGFYSIKREGIYGLYQINQENHAIQLNRCAFQQQCKQKYGCVISPIKDALEEQLPP